MLRRESLAGAGLLVGSGRTPVASLFGADDALAASTCASLTPSKTIGPYFVEEKLNRSDIRMDPSNGSTVAGIPLALALTLLDEDNACAPFAGAQVDIWHADPNGKYSDESGEGTAGKKYLRGYQVSDANGKVAFTTVYPGWYSGRAVHMHLRFRLFDSAGTSTTYDFTTQLFFDDALTDTVYRQAPYSSRSARDTRDANDNIYGSDGASLVLALTADGSGYAGAFTFGLSRSNQSAGDASGGAGGMPPAARDTTVAATVAAPKWVRGSARSRALVATFTAAEAVSLDVRVLRGSKQVARKQLASVSAGKRTVRLPLATSVTAGRATFQATIKDGSGNRKVISKIITVPK